MVHSLGRHLLIELYGCDQKILTDVRRVEEIMVEAVKATKAHIIDLVFHTFRPHGISGVIVISESHVTIHTWPEYGFAAIDIYTCGTRVNPWKAYKIFTKQFKAKNMNAIEFKRGMINIPRKKTKK